MAGRARQAQGSFTPQPTAPTPNQTFPITFPSPSSALRARNTSQSARSIGIGFRNAPRRSASQSGGTYSSRRGSTHNAPKPAGGDQRAQAFVGREQACGQVAARRELPDHAVLNNGRRVVRQLEADDAVDRGLELPRPLAGVPEAVSEEVDGAALPGAAEHLRDRGLQPAVGVGDRELHADQPALDQTSQEAGPERLGLGLADVDREDLAPPVSCTPCAITSALLTTRPPSRTFSTLASRNRYG
jgi:hypothetical protein